MYTLYLLHRYYVSESSTAYHETELNRRSLPASVPVICPYAAYGHITGVVYGVAL